MADGPAPSEGRDELLIERARAGLWLCLTSITIFGLTDPLLHPDELALIWGIKGLQLAGIAVFFVLLRRPLGRQREIRTAVAGVLMVAVTTSWSGIVTKDDVTTPLLLTVLTMGTATLLPWGVRPQIVTQAVTTLCIVWIGAGVGQPPRAYLPVVVVLSSSVSIYMAHALERHRVEQGQLRAALAESQSRQHQAEVMHAARLSSLGGMAAGLAHELNQPLAAVVSYARGCARRLQAGELPKEALLEVLEEISAQALRGGEVLRRIRDFLRGESRREWVDLNEVIRRAMRFATNEARDQDVRIELALAPEPLGVEVDPIQIEQVLLNLVQNAFEVMATNGGRERVVTVAASGHADRVEVTVTDTGPGIETGVAPRVFDPFFTTKPDGLGLGLSISRTIVESHGGRLTAESHAGAGTTFRFSVRRRAERAGEAA